jgi:hypothetical protein
MCWREADVAKLRLLVTANNFNPHFGSDVFRNCLPCVCELGGIAWWHADMQLNRLVAFMLHSRRSKRNPGALIP